MPHEIFLTAVVPDADVTTARSVLGGVTEMRERHQFNRVRYMQRQDAGPKTLDKLKEYYQKERGPNTVRWQELHQILLKQSYILQERISITQEVMASTGDAAAIVPPTQSRLLRWNDFPDPSSSRLPTFITQRKMLEIGDRRLPKILSDTKFIVKAESVEESYQWWLNNAEYSLTRTFPLAPGTQQEVPNMAGLEPLAPFWVLYVRIQVDSNPERMQQGHAQLSRVRDRLLRVFDFKVFDRRAHDTRNMEPRQL
ncbi:mediator complex, subunit Med18 [Lasiosphaeris hirsuta]|uniref:Mediator of RNA polymerase II transcription subunit 18 n=1 Tax=Lasiosphaeris hirsuta TaxID=260670 RepID=A0AA40DID3_9PEZI|nr:mediator complex, subunit Med18 [Lasiosphaeris hirsuta]